MKKAQLIGQIFVFVIGAILFGLILLYGYKAIATFGEQRREVALIEFQDDLKAAISKVSIALVASPLKLLKPPIMTTVLPISTWATGKKRGSDLNPGASVTVALIFNHSESSNVIICGF